jgi:hypothetical protein
MKTDDLIRAMAQDASVDPGAGRRRALALLAAGAAVMTGAFLLTFEVRDDLTDFDALTATIQKLVFTLMLLATGARGALSLMRPEADALGALKWIAAPVATILVFVGVEMALEGGGDLAERTIGSSAVECLVSVTMLALAPLAAFIYGLRAGAPARPDIAGALAGVAASSLAASLYALYCTDDSPLFVGAWYSVAVALVAALGWIVGGRALRW